MQDCICRQTHTTHTWHTHAHTHTHVHKRVCAHMAWTHVHTRTCTHTAQHSTHTRACMHVYRKLIGPHITATDSYAYIVAMSPSTLVLSFWVAGLLDTNIHTSYEGPLRHESQLWKELHFKACLKFTVPGFAENHLQACILFILGSSPGISSQVCSSLCWHSREHIGRIHSRFRWKWDMS